MKQGFKRTNNWNKYERKVKVQEGNRYLDLLINPGFQGVNSLFVLSFQIIVVEQVTPDIIFH